LSLIITLASPAMPRARNERRGWSGVCV